jgi:hypothetical protein
MRMQREAELSGRRSDNAPESAFGLVTDGHRDGGEHIERPATARLGMHPA